MTITKEEFRKRIHEIIQDKIFFSNISGNPVEVVEKLPEEIVPGKVLFDGMMLFDGIEGIEDDIQQMHSFTKDGVVVNLEDYYTDSGAFADDGKERFLAALERLMTLDEFIQFSKKGADGEDIPYPIDENGHVVIPEGTAEIIELAFEDCKNLVSVEIPGSVRVINYGAFYGCKVVLHREEELYGSDIDNKETRMFKADGNAVKQTTLDVFPYEESAQKSESTPQDEDDDDMPF